MKLFLKSSKATIQQILSGALWALAAAPLVVLTYIGTFARYLGDDYSVASAVKTYGFWGSQLYWYQHITGKITYTFLAVLLSYLGVYSVTWLQAICLLAWMSLLFFAFDYSFRFFGLALNKTWLAILTSLTIFATVTSTGDYSQVLHWQTNIVVYLSNSLAFAAIILYFARRFYLNPGQSVKNSHIFLSFVIFLLFGGLSQTWVIMQTALVMLGMGSLVLVRVPNIRNNFLKLLSAGMVGSIIAFLINFGSPGNVNLRDKDIYTFSIAWIFKSLFLSFLDALSFLQEWVATRTLVVITVLIVSILAGYIASFIQKRNPKNQALPILFCLVGSFALFWMSFFPGFFVFGSRPPERAIFTGMFVLVFGIVLSLAYLGYSLGCITPQASARVIKLLLYSGAFAVMVLSPLRTTIALINSIPLYKHYAQVWDQRDAFLRQANASGQKDVVVFSFKGDPDFRDLRRMMWVIGDLEPDPTYWVNQAAAVYYGLDSIVAKTK